MNRVLISGSGLVYQNLALEEALMRELGDSEIILYLWVNERAVVLGNNQCAHLECSPEACERSGVAVARRRSGGGAVYQDRGNLNFTFLYREGQADEGALKEIVRRELERLAGEPVEVSGNDLLIRGRKISGMAYYGEDGKMLLHGTVLVDVDLGAMSRVLTVRAKKLRSNGVDSVRKRVANLSEFAPEISVKRVLESLASGFFKTTGEGGFKVLRGERLPGDYAAYVAADWIYGESPDCELMEEAATERGIYQLLFKLEGKQIRDVRLYSDAEERENHETFLKSLEGTEFIEEQLQERLERYLAELPGRHWA